MSDPLPQWSIWGGPGSLPYRAYDALRDDLNRRQAAWLLAALTRHGVAPDRARALEAGSGPASTSTLLQRAGVRAVALDLDRAALALARLRDPALPLLQGDLLRAPLHPGEFDLVWSNSTVEHFPEPARAVAAMRDLTRPGGLVYVGVPARRGPFGLLARLGPPGLDEWIGPRFAEADLRGLLEGVGLRVLETRRYLARAFVAALARRA